jgi:hypothetical protein
MPEITGKGRAFPIGLLTPESRSNIKLAIARPFLNLPRVVRKPNDLPDQGLENLVRKQLLDRLTSGRAGGAPAPFDYFDAPLQAPDAILPQIESVLQDGRWSASVRLANSDKATDWRKTAEVSDPALLAAAIVQVILDLAASNSALFAPKQ